MEGKLCDLLDHCFSGESPLNSILVPATWGSCSRSARPSSMAGLEWVSDAAYLERAKSRASDLKSKHFSEKEQPLSFHQRIQMLVEAGTGGGSVLCLF